MKYLFLLLVICFSFALSQEPDFKRIGEQNGYALYEKSVTSQKEDTVRFTKPGYSKVQIIHTSESVTEDTIYLSLAAEKAMDFVNWWWLKNVLENGTDELTFRKDEPLVERPWQKLGFKKIITTHHKVLVLSPEGKINLNEYNTVSEKNAEAFIAFVILFSAITCGALISKKISIVGQIGYAFLASVAFVLSLSIGDGQLVFTLICSYFVVAIFSWGEEKTIRNVLFNFLFTEMVVVVICYFLDPTSSVLILVANIHSLVIGYLASFVFTTLFPKSEKKPALT